MRYVLAFLLFSSVILLESSLLAKDGRSNVFFSVKEGVMGEHHEVAVRVTKSTISPPSLQVVHTYGESEAGSACIKKEYFLLYEESITHGETFYYCVGFVSEQFIKIGYMHQDRRYSADSKTLAKTIRLLNEIYEGGNSKFRDVMVLLDQLSNAEALTSKSEQTLDDRAYWRRSPIVS
jgi:hypothetical protein